MANTIKIKFYLIFIVAYASISAFGQNLKQDTTLYKISMKNGNQFYGLLIKEVGDTITFDVSKIGKIALLKEELDSYTISKGPKFYTTEKELMYKDNYFLSENAFTPKSGSIYYQSQDLLHNRFTFGLTDHIALETGFLIFPDEDYFGMLAIKASFSASKYIHLGLKTQFYEGVDYYRVITNSGLVTIGTINENITIGVHSASVLEKYYYEDYEPQYEKKTVYSLSGTVALSKKSAFKFEHIRFNKDVSMLTVGLSYNTKHVSFTYGVLFISNTEYFIQDENLPFPVLGLKIPLKSN
jgi:hypothetical protein